VGFAIGLDRVALAQEIAEQAAKKDP